MKQCASCGKQLPQTSVFCDKCGTALPNEQPETKICGNCNSEVKAEMIFCDKCGAKCTQAVSPPPTQPYIAPAPPQYGQTQNTPAVTPYNPAQPYKKNPSPISKDTALIIATYVLGVIGLFIALITYEFGFGELLVIGSVVCAVMSKNKIAYVGAGIFAGLNLMLFMI